MAGSTTADQKKQQRMADRMSAFNAKYQRTVESNDINGGTASGATAELDGRSGSKVSVCG